MIAIQEAIAKKELDRFIRFPWRVYQDDANWVPPVIADTRRMLDRGRSPFFEFGEAAYFLAYKDGRCAGRVSAHINRNHNEYHGSRDGFFGFYESIDDFEVSDALMGAAARWVADRGMSKLIGPASFTVYDEQCFMVEGWEADPPTPVVFETYNPRYYIEQMSHAGLAKEIDWYAFKVDRMGDLSEAFLNAKDRLLKRNGFVFRTIDLKRLDSEVAKIKEIFNRAWAVNWGHYPFTDGQMEAIRSAIVHFIDTRICFMVETSEGQPVGVSITLPDINPFVKKMNGRILPVGWIYLLRSRHHSVGVRTFMMGVLPEYRNMGVDIAMVVETMKVGSSIGYKWAECSLIVENNRNMIRPVEKWGGVAYKTYRLFSKVLR